MKKYPEIKVPLTSPFYENLLPAPSWNLSEHEEETEAFEKLVRFSRKHSTHAKWLSKCFKEIFDESVRRV